MRGDCVATAPRRRFVGKITLLATPADFAGATTYKFNMSLPSMRSGTLLLNRNCPVCILAGRFLIQV
jgi:hypothetical protein